MSDIKKNAVITGATGFIGSHLARRLVYDGWKVHLIVRYTSKLTLIQDIQDDVIIHRYDGSVSQMPEIFEAADPTIVFHLASLFLVRHEAVDIEPLIRSNILFGTQLVEGMVSRGIDRLVNTGTAWEHFENEAYNPVNLYAATKHAFESILRFYIEAAGLKVITLKLSDTYGPLDPRPKLFSVLRKAAEGQPVAMSPGEQLIDLVYIDDVVNAFVLTAARLLYQQVSGHEIYSVTSNEPISLRELVKIYEQETGACLSLKWGERPYRAREVMVPWGKGNKLPNWNVKISLRKGIRMIANKC